MEQLIEIWQSVQTDQSKTDKKYKPEDLFPQVIKLEKNQKNVLLFKTLSSISILFLLIMVFITQFTLALNGIIGIGIITISILGSVILLNRLRFRISDEERSLSTNSLVQVVETKIKNEEKIYKCQTKN